MYCKITFETVNGNGWLSFIQLLYTDYDCILILLIVHIILQVADFSKFSLDETLTKATELYFDEDYKPAIKLFEKSIINHKIVKDAQLACSVRIWNNLINFCSFVGTIAEHITLFRDKAQELSVLPSYIGYGQYSNLVYEFQDEFNPNVTLLKKLSISTLWWSELSHI